MTVSPIDEHEAFRHELERCWPLAQAHWSRFLLLREPIIDSAQLSVAQIDLWSRQVAVNQKMILETNLEDCLEAILAHEVGHHVRFPGTTQTSARLRLLERSLIPFENDSIINHFTDLMINESLGDRFLEPMLKIYRSFVAGPELLAKAGWKRNPVYFFYVAIYEELWGQEPGSLMGAAAAGFGDAYPGYRAEARVLSEQLFVLGPNLYTQFLYFLSVMVRYLTPLDEDLERLNLLLRCGCGEPTPADWAEAVTPSAAELEAIRRAIAEGWFEPDQAKRLQENNQAENRIAGLPGYGTEHAIQVPEIMAAYYRRQAEQYLLRPPPQLRLGELQVPTTLEEWEPGDPIRDIDWMATLMLRGRELGGALPLKRLKVAEEEGLEAPLWQPRMEIYLDVSGSMPNPCDAINSMTLAAQILATGTTQAGGWVRALLYSSAPLLFWEWSRSETEVSRFLMHYLGGGTDFPFHLLEASVKECAGDQPIRVIITDRDFDANVGKTPDHVGVLTRAVTASPHLVLLLHAPASDRVAFYRGLGASVVPVEAMDDFPRLAADLTLALFPEATHGSI